MRRREGFIREIPKILTPCSRKSPRFSEKEELNRLYGRRGTEAYTAREGCSYRRGGGMPVRSLCALRQENFIDPGTPGNTGRRTDPCGLGRFRNWPCLRNRKATLVGMGCSGISKDKGRQKNQSQFDSKGISRRRSGYSVAG